MNSINLKNTILLLLLLGLQGVGNNVLASEPSPETMRDRLQACAGCHAVSDQTIAAGVSGGEAYYPSIDGKPVEYLYQQLLNFRDGRRDNPLMQQMLAYLSSEYLHDMAVYYAQKPSTYVPPVSESKPAPGADSERARSLVERSDGERPACTACHGEDLNGDGVAIPGLRGLGSAYIAAQLGAWQAGTRSAREPDCMAQVARKLDGADVAVIARWIANAPRESDSAESSVSSRDLPLPCGAVQ